MFPAHISLWMHPSKNHLARSIQVLQVFFLQEIKILQEIYLAVFLASSCKISVRFFNSCKKSFVLVQDLQDLVQELASLVRKILVRLAFFLQDGFYWEPTLLHMLAIA